MDPLPPIWARETDGQTRKKAADESSVATTGVTLNRFMRALQSSRE